MSGSQVSLLRKAVGELVGTFLLVLFGCGSVHAAVLTGAQQGLWQVAIVWALGIAFAIYAVGGVSGAHLNPAITCAFALWRKFPWREVPVYVLGQLAGAFAAAAVLFSLFSHHLLEKEVAKGVIRGQAGSEITAMCYGEYFPNPGVLAAGDALYSAERHEALRELTPLSTALLAEFLGTSVLAFVIFAATDRKNPSRPSDALVPLVIGLTVAALISVLAPLTQAGFNPARDFAPRLYASLAGWGEIAWPGSKDWSWLTVYILAPIAGAVFGGGFYEGAIGRRHAEGTPTEA